MKTEATLSSVAAKITASGATNLILTLTVKHGPKVNADHLLTLIGQTLDMQLTVKQVSMALTKGKKTDGKEKPGAVKTETPRKDKGKNLQPLPQSSFA